MFKTLRYSTSQCYSLVIFGMESLFSTQSLFRGILIFGYSDSLGAIGKPSIKTYNDVVRHGCHVKD